MENQLPARKNLRLTDYDYNTPGAYFITICTHNRRNMWSRIVGAIHESPAPHLTDWGNIADRVIRDLPENIGVTVDRYVIMPNHIHMILMINDSDYQRAIRESPLRGRSIISKAVGYIKMNASKSIRNQYGDISVWQRGYYDHIIRNEQDYITIANYIDENPLKWKLDKLYSAEECML